jgi:hypothetical protein
MACVVCVSTNRQTEMTSVSSSSLVPR